ncbi:MAG TPA: OST-HTH/LOTUS domain-containing protein [Polyangiaceae bacterium]|nr:OST-HTH/LOTUS domain-containing protein [Polyangiaceae bacterium]
MSDPRNPAIDELHRRLGRNVLMFRRIEQTLRFLLPYLHPDGGAKGAEALRAYAAGIERSTLGPLVEEFKARCGGTPEWSADKLTELVDARNELLHHFYRHDRFSLLTPNGLADALVCLDEQHVAAQEWHEVLRVQSLLLLLVLVDTNEAVAAQFGEHRERLLAQLPASVEVVDLADPRGTVWASTRIVKLLRLAERHTERVDGMTLLANAGRYINEVAPDIAPRDYGLRRLRQVLVESQLFDVRGGENGGEVRYRSKPELEALPLDLETRGLSFSLVRQR